MTARLTVKIGATTLTAPFGVRASLTANRVGDGEFSLLPDDPQRSLCVRHAVAEIAKDGVPFAWIRIDDINEVEAEAGSDTEVERVVFSGPESVAELARVATLPPFFGIDGAGQTAGRKISVDPWDTVRLFGYPDPTQATQLLGTAGGADDVTRVRDSRPDGWPDPDAWWVGDSGGASECYFAGRIDGADVSGTRFHMWVGFGGEGWLYHQNVLICHVSAADATQTKCWTVEVPVNPGVDQVFTARVRTAGTSSTNALFAFTCHDPDAYDPMFFFRTSTEAGQTWGMFADPATPPGVTPGELATQMIVEHNAVEGETLDWLGGFTFNGEVDSAGNLWPSIPILPAQVGDPFPTVLERMSEAWIEWACTGESELSVWSAAGVDTPDGVAPGRGLVRDIILAKGAQILDLSRRDSGPIVNVLLCRWGRGFVRIVDDDSVAAHGAHVGMLDCGDISDLATVERMARQNLALTATPVVSIEATIDDRDPESGWSPVVDWMVGDTLTVEGDGWSEDVRCVALEATESDDYVEVVTEWGTARDALEDQQHRWMSRTQNGTLDGRSPTPVVSVTSPSIVRQGVAQVVPITFAATGTYAVAVGDRANRARRHVNGIAYAVNCTAQNAGLADTVCYLEVNGTTVLTGLTLPAGEDDWTVWFDYAELVTVAAADSLNVEVTSAGGAQGWAANVLVVPVGDQPS